MIKESISAVVYILSLPVIALIELVRASTSTRLTRNIRKSSSSNGNSHLYVESRQDPDNNDESSSNSESNIENIDDEKKRIRQFDNRSITPDTLLSIKQRNLMKRKVLILDLDETLVHSTPIEPFPQFVHLYQYSIDIYIDNTQCTFYVSERPHLKEFMRKVCEWYEVVIFTASVRNYADPVIDKLECSKKIAARYFREV